MHGNNKSLEELRMALDSRVGHIVIDNFLEIDQLSELMAGRKDPQAVLIRVAPGIDPHTHRRISTGQVDTKFGFGVASGAALAAIKRVEEIAGLDLKGLHCHVGSQLLDTECHEESVAIMVDLLAQVKQELGLEFEELNIGGGLGIRYLSSHQPPSIQSFAEAVTRVIRRKLKEAGLAEPTLLLEPGRSLIGEAGTTLYTLGAVKDVPGIRTYVSVDGGLSDNPRPALYEAKYEAIVANKAGQPHETVVTVAGKHCETDILIQAAQTQPLETGDILAVQSTGAYNYAMASNYNTRAKPAEILIEGASAKLIRRRETLVQLWLDEI